MRRFQKIILLMCFLIMTISGCDGSRPNGSPHESGDATKETSLDSYRRARLEVEAVAIAQPPSDPLKTAMALVGLDVAHLAIPQGLKENYRLLARNPLIDRFSQAPLQLAQWAEGLSDRVQAKASSELLRLVEQIEMSLNGGVSYADQIKTHDDTRGLAAACAYLYRQAGTTLSAADLAAIQMAGFTTEFDNLLGELVFALADASMLCRHGIEALSADEIEFLTTRPERYFFNDDGTFRFLSAPTHVQRKVLRIARKIDFKALMTAGLILCKAADSVTTAVLRQAGETQKFPFCKKAASPTGMVLDLTTPIGPLIVLGEDSSTLTQPAALVVDLGGNDRYKTAVATGHMVPGRCALHIDLGGDDIYGQKKRSFSQGVGILGVGLLVDCNGRDEYLAAHMAQGCGMYGWGGIVDIDGDDLYSMGLMGQGFGVFGMGLLVDRKGNDRYLMSGMGQGAGATMGCGVLCDVQGNDKYLADRERRKPDLQPDIWCHAQGAGLSVRSPDWAKQASFYGGIGLLSDGAGKDFYHATGGNVMGSSYFKSIGALVDHGGDDTYVPKKGYGIGFAVHLSHAVLVDKGGNDQYIAATHTGGVASDRSIAIFIDASGDDLYGPSPEYVQALASDAAHRKDEPPTASQATPPKQELAALSYGAAQKRRALGLMIDLAGNDRYYAQTQGQGESCGGVMPPQLPQYWSHAVLLDLGGTDYYELPGRRDNTYFKYHHHGICYDTEIARPWMPTPSDQAVRIRKPPAEAAIQILARTDDLRPVVQALGDADLFVRFAALGKVIQKGPLALDMLLTILSVSSDRELNRDLMEALDDVYLTRKIRPRDAARIARLLKAPDGYVQQYAARLLGALRFSEAVPLLMQALPTANMTTRADIIWALGNIADPKAMTPLIAETNQPSDVLSRRAAIEALGRISPKISSHGAAEAQSLKATLTSFLEDDDVIVRYQAAKALYPYKNDPAVKALLKRRLDDTNCYVQRAAAQAVIESGDPAGIPVLIDTLRFRSIDTYEFYDMDLAKTLAFYCGVDFPDAKRFDYQTWQDWWRVHGASVNLDHNLEIKRQIEAAFATYPEQSGIKTFEHLMRTENGKAMVKRRYQRFCQDRIRYLLGHRTIKRRILERCIALQRILTALDPDDPKARKQLLLFEQQSDEFN